MGKPQDPGFLTVFGCLTVTNFKGNETHKYFSNIFKLVPDLSTSGAQTALPPPMGTREWMSVSGRLQWASQHAAGGVCSASCRKHSYVCSEQAWVCRHVLSTKLSPDILPHICLADGHTLTRYNLPHKYQLPSTEDYSRKNFRLFIPSAWYQSDHPARIAA